MGEGCMSASGIDDQERETRVELLPYLTRSEHEDHTPQGGENYHRSFTRACRRSSIQTPHRRCSPASTQVS
jgi:hypothetical protein